jgi:hypothetical protein
MYIAKSSNKENKMAKDKEISNKEADKVVGGIVDGDQPNQVNPYGYDPRNQSKRYQDELEKLIHPTRNPVK